MSRELLLNVFRTAIDAAHPSHCLPKYLPKPPKGRVIVLAAGKAAGAMTEAAEQFYIKLSGINPRQLTGIAVTRHGYERPAQYVQMVGAGHPIPDGAGLAAATAALSLADSAQADDLVLAMISGGASANWIAPAPGVSFSDKQAVTRALLRSGANIGEINTVRKHLSRIKGGRLARAARPAHIVTLAISDVPGDDPAVIGSGPTVPDTSTLAEARAVIAHYKLQLPASVTQALDDPNNESPKPGDEAFANSEFHLIARPADSLRAAEIAVRANGYDCISLGADLEGEARDVAAAHAKLAREMQAQGKRAIIISGGELTVTMRGTPETSGRGGPNQEYALALAAALNGAPGIAALAADTDGTDGGAGSAADPAGAMIDETTLQRARAAGLDPQAYLARNDSTGFFEALGDLVQTGPTCTNVNDFRAIVVDTP